jgi:hypothetical protein
MTFNPVKKHPRTGKFLSSAQYRAMYGKGRKRRGRKSRSRGRKSGSRMGSFKIMGVRMPFLIALGLAVGGFMWWKNKQVLGRPTTRVGA